MKALKIVGKIVVALVVLVVIAVLAMPLWFGPVVKTVANAVVPGVTKTDFRLEHISLNPYTGRFELKDMKLSNPEGYSEKYAATLGDIAFDLGMMTLTDEVVHIEEIKVKGVFVSVVSKDGVGNFEQIQYNVAGGKEKYEAAQAKKEAEKKAAAEKEQPVETTAEPEAEKPAKKFIIDHMEISGVKIQLGFLPISIPVDIKLDDIGKKSQGATIEEVWDAIVASVMKAAGVAGDQLKALGGAATDALKGAGEMGGKALDTATDALGSAGKSVGNAASAATESVGNAASAATDAIGSGAKAVGEGAGKALDKLKSLW